MPEKRSDSKIMAMLERSGVLRKVDTDENVKDADFNDLASRNDSDIKPLFDVPDSPTKVTPAARQPIPGMSSPVFPEEKPTNVASAKPQRFDEPEQERTVEAMPAPSTYTEPPEVSAPPQPTQPQRPASSFGGLNLFRNGGSPEEAPVAAAPERESQAENYTERFLNTDELYEALALRSKKTDSIYLIEEYLQTLPDSLPDSSRREIVGKLIAASGFDYDLLMGDGVLRVKMLKEYAERFARHTDDYIAARQAELDEMDQQILRTRRLIENRKELHKKQFFSIEAEAQRLKEILTFISG